MRVAIGSSSFAEVSAAPLDLLKGHGIEVVPNPLGRRMTEDEIPAHIAGCDGLIAGLEPLTRAILSTAPKLRAVARIGVGLDTVDLAAAEEFGIRVSSTPTAPAEAVAEFAVAAMIMLSRSAPVANAALHAGRWERLIGRSLSESVVLIIGYGRIGQRVAQLLEPFRAHVIVHDPYVDYGAEDARFVSLAEGLGQADIVTLHAAGTAAILDGVAFDHMRPGTVVLNSGRGGLIDEDALVEALDAGIVTGAWLDVFAKEPYVGTLSTYPQVILTPHMATHTRETRLRMELEAVENLMDDLEVTSP
jgi:D-3-phosphoglycerate dehydrogenase